MALVLTCNCERAVAASHTFVVDGVSGIGVAVASITGVTLGRGRGVKVISKVFVGKGVAVCVGEAVEVDVVVERADVGVA